MQRRRTFVDEVHGVLVEGDMSRTERSDGSGGSIHADEVIADLAVVFESSGNGESGGKVAAERVNQHVHFLAFVLGEHRVNVGAVEVLASDVAFELDVIGRFRHGKINFTTKLDLYLIRVKDTPKC